MATREPALNAICATEATARALIDSRTRRTGVDTGATVVVVVVVVVVVLSVVAGARLGGEVVGGEVVGGPPSTPDVMTRLPAPLTDVATNSLFPYVTDLHVLSAGDVRTVQVTPSGLDMMRLPVPDIAVATKSPFP